MNSSFKDDFKLKPTKEEPNDLQPSSFKYMFSNIFPNKKKLKIVPVNSNKKGGKRRTRKNKNKSKSKSRKRHY